MEMLDGDEVVRVVGAVHVGAGVVAVVVVGDGAEVGADAEAGVTRLGLWLLALLKQMMATAGGTGTWVTW